MCLSMWSPTALKAGDDLHNDADHDHGHHEGHEGHDDLANCEDHRHPNILVLLIVLGDFDQLVIPNVVDVLLAAIESFDESFDELL